MLWDNVINISTFNKGQKYVGPESPLSGCSINERNEKMMTAIDYRGLYSYVTNTGEINW